MRHLWLLLFLFGIQKVMLSAPLDIDSLRRNLKEKTPDSASIAQALVSFYFMPPSEVEGRNMLMLWSKMGAIKTRDFFSLSKCYLFSGNDFLKSQNYSRAIEALDTAYTIAERIQSHSLMAKILNEKGNIEYDFIQFPKAIVYYKLAIQQAIKAKENKLLAISYSNLSSMYFVNNIHNRDSMRMAIELSKDAYKIQKDLGQTLESVFTLDALAYMYVETGQIDSAFKVLDVSGKILEQFPQGERLMIYYFRKATAYEKLKDYQSVLYYLNTGDVYLRQSNSMKWQYLYSRQYARAYAKLGDHVTASPFYEKYIRLHDSIISRDNYQKNLLLYALFETEQKAKNIEQLARQNRLNELLLIQEKQEQRRLYIQFLGAGFVLIVFGFILIVLFRLNKSFKVKQQALEQRSVELSLLSQKEIQQNLLLYRYQSQMNPHMIFNALQSIQGKILKGNHENSFNYVEQFKRLFERTYRLSEEHQVLISDEIIYLQEYLRFECERSNNLVQFNPRMICPEAMIPPLLLQPLVENALKHGKLFSRPNPFIDIDFLIVDGENLEIIIRDNGVGTNKSLKDLMQNSHALSILLKRISICWDEYGRKVPDQVLSIESSPDKGFQLQIVLPFIGV